VTGGGLSPDGTKWISSRKGYFLPVKVLSHLSQHWLLRSELSREYISFSVGSFWARVSQQLVRVSRFLRIPTTDPFLICAEQWQEGVVLDRRMSSSGRGVRQILK